MFSEFLPNSPSQRNIFDQANRLNEINENLSKLAKHEKNVQ